MDFFQKALYALKDYESNGKMQDTKLLLGVMDNLRNVALMNLNAAIVSGFPQYDRLYLSLSAYNENEQVKNWHEICNDIYKEMYQLCFVPKMNNESHTTNICNILEKLWRISLWL